MSENEQNGSGGAGGQQQADPPIHPINIPGLQPPQLLKAISPGAWIAVEVLEATMKISFVAGLSQQLGRYQIALFLYVLGPKFLDVYKGFVFDNDAQMNNIDEPSRKLMNMR